MGPADGRSPAGGLAWEAAARAPRRGARHKVALVGKSETSEFFRSVYAGAQAAATEYNLDLTISSPETEEDYETQNQLVEEAVAAGAEALVFSAADYENSAQAIDAAAAQGVRIVAIDSNVNSKGGGDLHRHRQLCRRPDGGPGRPGRDEGPAGGGDHQLRCPQRQRPGPGAGGQGKPLPTAAGPGWRRW